MSRPVSAVLYGIAAVLLLISLAAFRMATRSRQYRMRMAWTVASSACVLGCTYAALFARKVSG